jgi:ketopantoate reductase
VTFSKDAGNKMKDITSTPQKVTVVGAGSIGRFIAYLLSGNPMVKLTLLAHSMDESTKKIQNSGIVLYETLTGSEAAFRKQHPPRIPKLVTADPTQVDDQDIIVVTVKNYDLTEDFLAQLHGKLNSKGKICIFTATVPEIYSGERIIQSYFVTACEKGDGGSVISNRPLSKTLLLAEYHDQSIASDFLSLFEGQIKTTDETNQSVLIRSFGKLQFILTYNMISLFMIWPFGEITKALENNELKKLFINYFSYVVELSRYLGGPDVRGLEQLVSFKPTPDHFSSMCHDRINGKPLELRGIIEQIFKLLKDNPEISATRPSLEPLDDLYQLAEIISSNANISESEIKEKFLGILQKTSTIIRQNEEPEKITQQHKGGSNISALLG